MKNNKDKYYNAAYYVLFTAVITILLMIILFGLIRSKDLETYKPKRISYIQPEYIIKYWNYTFKADSILTSYNSTISGKILANAWKKTYLNYNVDVPLSLALSQLQLESSFGKSRIAIKHNNPYNIVIRGKFANYNTLEEGIEEYYKLIATRYLSCKSIEQLLISFTNCSNHRYAESPTYEASLKPLINKYAKVYY
jgi:hypothetical protein